MLNTVDVANVLPVNMPAEKKKGCVLICGEEPTRSAPTLTWSRALERAGMSCRFVSETEFVDTRCWLKLLHGARAVVFQWYVELPPFLTRQLAWAPLMRVPVIRKWSGTDAYNCLLDAGIRASAAELDRIVSANLAASENLVAELSSMGLSAQAHPNVLSSPESYQPRDKTFRPRAVLIYLPATRKEFYGYPLVQATVEKFRALEFIVVGDDSHSLANWPNVKSLGWVEDMEAIWPNVGLLLRFTEHDGMPRMVLEALARRKYVLHNHPVPGCWLAQTEGEVISALARFSDINSPNFEGDQIAAGMIGPENDVVLGEAIGRARVTWSILGHAVGVLAKYKLAHRNVRARGARSSKPNRP
jgi:hypothetical protein